MWNLTTKKTLLIIDDDEVMVLLLKKLFEKSYNIYTGSDGVEAIDHLNKGLRPNLIITDIVMDNINGVQLIKHLATSALYKHIPVIVLSGSKDIHIPYHPVFSVLYKPFNPLQLKEMVEVNILKKHEINIMQ